MILGKFSVSITLVYAGSIRRYVCLCACYISKETKYSLIHVAKHLLRFDPYRNYDYTREYRKNERRKGGKGIRERESGRKDTNDDMMKKCKARESNTRREDIYAMRPVSE
jgi:hypothetical protein